MLTVICMSFLSVISAWFGCKLGNLGIIEPKLSENRVKMRMCTLYIYVNAPVL